MKRLMTRAKPALARAQLDRRRGVCVLAACFAMTPIAAHCAAQVSGSPQAVSVNAGNSPLKDILAELGKQFDFQAESSANLDKPLTGTYRGSLEGVVSALLEGYDFIIRTGRGGLELTVFGGKDGQGGSAPFTVVAGRSVTGVAAGPAPASTKVQVHTLATTSAPAGPDGSAAVAEGGPSPAPPSASANDLAPRPATGAMPTPTPSTETMPAIGAPTPFPMVRGTNRSTPSAATTSTSPTPHKPITK